MNARPPLQDIEAILASMSRILEPLAQLALTKGVGFDAMEEAMKRAMVKAGRQAAMQAQPGVDPNRLVSRISTATGINRREVTRITNLQDAPVSHRPPVATEVFTRWLSDPVYVASPGHGRVLPRQGTEPSFESLAQSITRDVHPRAVLDELCRLGLARVDEQDQVHLCRDAFVPRGDALRMIEFLGENVGDHLSAAVDNTLSTTETPHFEQALFADELSEPSLEVIRALLRQHWKQLLSEATELLEKQIDLDRQGSEPANQRIRIGLYSYSTTVDTWPGTPEL